MSVVKANAYGHGLALVAKTLFSEGCRLFAVTDAKEGCRLRSILQHYGTVEGENNSVAAGKQEIASPAKDQGAGIVLLSGIFDARDAETVITSDLTPTLTDEYQVKLLKAAKFKGKVWLKIDTGMQRLGTENLSRLYRMCQFCGLHVAGIMSHLACADIPDHPDNSRQSRAFKKILGSMPSGTAASLLNSAGLATMPESSFNVVRPGIALYGVEPAAGIQLGVRPVMRLTANVIQVRVVPKGTSVSYGATYTANREMRLAVICLGYADGLQRALSNHGAGIWKEKKMPIAGRICMDYCILEAASYDVQPGDSVEFWGEQQLASEVATSIDTIAYELFTQVNTRVPRIAVEIFS